MDHLTRIRRAAAQRDRRRAAFDDADAELRQLIREGVDARVPATELAAAAGLTVQRIYQIRDGRR